MNSTKEKFILDKNILKAILPDMPSQFTAKEAFEKITQRFDVVGKMSLEYGPKKIRAIFEEDHVELGVELVKEFKGESKTPSSITYKKKKTSDGRDKKDKKEEGVKLTLVKNDKSGDSDPSLATSSAEVEKQAVVQKKSNDGKVSITVEMMEASIKEVGDEFNAQDVALVAYRIFDLKGRVSDGYSTIKIRELLEKNSKKLGIIVTKLYPNKTASVPSKVTYQKASDDFVADHINDSDFVIVEYKTDSVEKSMQPTSDPKGPATEIIETENSASTNTQESFTDVKVKITVEMMEASIKEIGDVFNSQELTKVAYRLFDLKGKVSDGYSTIKVRELLEKNAKKLGVIVRKVYPHVKAANPSRVTYEKASLDFIQENQDQSDYVVVTYKVDEKDLSLLSSVHNSGTYVESGKSALDVVNEVISLVKIKYKEITDIETGDISHSKYIHEARRLKALYVTLTEYAEQLKK